MGIVLTVQAFRAALALSRATHSEIRRRAQSRRECRLGDKAEPATTLLRGVRHARIWAIPASSDGGARESRPTSAFTAVLQPTGSTASDPAVPAVRREHGRHRRPGRCLRRAKVPCSAPAACRVEGVTRGRLLTRSRPQHPKDHRTARKILDAEAAHRDARQHAPVAESRRLPHTPATLGNRGVNEICSGTHRSDGRPYSAHERYIVALPTPVRLAWRSPGGPR